MKFSIMFEISLYFFSGQFGTEEHCKLRLFGSETRVPVAKTLRTEKRQSLAENEMMKGLRVKSFVSSK